MIKFVYFDVGGVVVKDFSASNKWEELQTFLGVTPVNREKFLTFWAKHRNRICIDLDLESLIPEMNTEVGLSVPSSLSILQEFIKRFEKNETIWPAITEIKKTMSVGLLTNMYVCMLDAIKKKRILPPVKWDRIIDSSIVKLQKPDPQIFKYAEQKTGVKSDEILFIDNQEKHINAAKQCGWQSCFYDSADYENSSKKLAEYLKSIL